MLVEKVLYIGINNFVYQRILSYFLEKLREVNISKKKRLLYIVGILDRQNLV